MNKHDAEASRNLLSKEVCLLYILSVFIADEQFVSVLNRKEDDTENSDVYINRYTEHLDK